jgi:nitroimidazol reductase NimA-like FMN-containing flavoprotein (pyridoxamine 5'-phosphate oxidase superfamily)
VALAAAFTFVLRSPPVRHESIRRKGLDNPIVKDEEARHRLEGLLHGQPLGVLATGAGAGVHATLVAFAATDDLREIVFATSRATRKYEFLQENPRTALLVDDRSNEVRDFRDACAVTAHGIASEVSGRRLDELRDLYLRRHPYLDAFVRAPSCALLSIAVKTYDLVGNFQEVHVLRVGDDSVTSG